MTTINILKRFVLLLAACLLPARGAVHESSDVGQPGDAARLPTVETSWQTVRPTETDAPLMNPYCGWGLWAGPRYFDGRPFTLEDNTRGFGDDAPLFSWVLVDWMWSDLEPEEGQFKWDELDALIAYWAQRGKQIYLRAWVTDDPGWNGAPGNEVCPEWLWKAGVRFHEYTGEGKSRKREPDYADPSFIQLYLPKARSFLQALAERYEKPGGPVCLWGAMGYGQWGEWHVMWSHYRWPSPQVKHQVLERIVNLYADTFKAQSCISYCFDDDTSQVTRLEDFLHRQALDVALAKGFALARHGFIDGLGRWDTAVMRKYWRQAPMLAEGDWSYSDMKTHGTHGTLDENLRVMLNWHSTYAHFYLDAHSYRRAMRDDKAGFAKGLQSGGLGYRLVPTSMSWRERLQPGQLLVLDQIWENRNVSLCFHRYLLKLCLTDARGEEQFSEVDRAFDPTSWVKGEEHPLTSVFHLPGNLRPGEYDVRIALVDEQGQPRVRLGVEGADSRLRYRLGAVRITPPSR